jgi:hypothetical protein
MTCIITSDLEKIIENSIIELNKKIKENITNNISRSTESIYELNDIKDFGKLSDPTLSNIYNFIENKYSIYSNVELFPYNHVYLKLTEGEYPILMCSEISNSSGQIHYITNIIDGLMLNNDDILFLILIAIKINKKRKQPIYKPCSIVVKYLKENNFIDTDSDNEYILNRTLKYYFANIHDNKIKAFEFDKLINNNKLLEDENYDFIEENNNLLDKIIKLKEENYTYCKKISELYEDNYKQNEDNYKQKEANIDLSDKIIKLEEEVELIKNNENNLIEDNNKLVEDNNKLVEDNNNIVEYNNKLKNKIYNMEKEFETIIKENKNTRLKIVELIENMKNISDENIKTIEEKQKLINKIVDLMDEKNKLVEIINILSDKDINNIIMESDITNMQQILLEIKEERNNIYIENNRLKNLNNKLEINENQLSIDYVPIIKKYEKTQMNIISFYNLIICLFILYSFYFF